MKYCVYDPVCSEYYTDDENRILIFSDKPSAIEYVERYEGVYERFKFSESELVIEEVILDPE